ncbi:MAG: hypothetical protein ACRDYF_13605 [Acidimicrobiia bacterium]
MLETAGPFHEGELALQEATAVNPAAGLLFIDFAAGESLQLTGATAIDLHAPDDEGRTGGTGRAWTLTPSRWRRAPLPARLRTEFLDFSPFNP